ncbi:MAG TPA: hypothetical protein VG944_18180 [Fimbriimonas sp.]|nr:hypothetical protein [Fimbriimonas sp.]
MRLPHGSQEGRNAANAEYRERIPSASAGLKERTRPTLGQSTRKLGTYPEKACESLALRLLTTLLLVALATLAFSQQDESKEIRARMKYERVKIGGSSVEAARAHLTAFYEARRYPQWLDDRGGSPKWEEIGPTVIEHGWGDMENAGRICSLAVSSSDPRVLYAAAASGGIWKSEDQGKNWNPIADHIPTMSVGTVCVDPFDPDTIYAGTGEPNYSLDSFDGTGFLRSTDSGKTWDLLGGEVFMGYRFVRIVPNPSRPGFLYAATTRGVLRTTDYGATWVEILGGPASDLVIDPKDPDTLIAAIGLPWGSKTNGLYKTHDAGQTWTHLQQGLPTNPLVLGRLQLDNCKAYPNVVYAAMYGNGDRLVGLYKSTDFGESWILEPNCPNYAGGQAWYDNCLAVSPTNPNVLFVGGTSTYRSLDGGETWEDNTRSYAGGPIHPDHHWLTFSPFDSKTLYLTTDGGIFCTKDLGATWEAINNGLATVQFQSVDVDPNDPNVAYGGTQDNGTNKFSGNKKWTNTFLGDGGVTRVNWKDPKVVYTEYVGLAILKSVDSGQSWSWDATRGIDPHEHKLFYAPFNLDPSDPDTLVAGAEKVYRSTNAAESWTAISPKLGGEVSAVTVAKSSRKVIYAGTSIGKVWVTSDTGEHWYDITKGLPRAYVEDIAVDPDNARIVYVALGGWAHNRIWKSTDAGFTWTCLGLDLPALPVTGIALHPRHPKTIYIATSIGVFVSERGDGRWKRMGSSLPNVPVFSIVANPRTNYITIGTHGRGAWRIRLPI